MTGARGADASPPARARPTLLVLLAAAAFATSSPLGRYARPAPALAVAFGRLALAAVVLLALDASGLGGAVARLGRRERLLTAAGGALLGAHFACFQWGLDHTSLAAAASLVSLEPLSVVVVAWALFGLRPGWIDRAALLLATGGALAVASGSGAGEHRLIGDAVVLVAVLLFGLYLAVARALRGALPTRSYVALVYGGASITLALLLPLSEATRPSALAALPSHAFAAIALLAVVPTLVGHTAVQAAARSLPPAVVALVSPLETLGAIAIGAAALGERPSTREMAGGALILLGTAVGLLRPEPGGRGGAQAQTPRDGGQASRAGDLPSVDRTVTTPPRGE